MKSKDLRYQKLSDHTELLKEAVQDMLDAGKISQAQYNETVDMLDELLAEQKDGKNERI